jgi:hypothetical protein
MRDPGRVLGADELLPLLAQTGQRGAHTVHLPTGCRCQVADCSAIGLLQQSKLAGPFALVALIRPRPGRGSCEGPNAE